MMNIKKYFFQSLLIFMALVIIGCSTTSNKSRVNESQSSEFDVIYRELRTKLVKGENIIIYPSVAEAAKYIARALKHQYEREPLPRFIISYFTTINGGQNRLCKRVEKSLGDEIKGIEFINKEDFKKIKKLQAFEQESGVHNSDFYEPQGAEYLLTGVLDYHAADEVVRVHVRVINKGTHQIYYKVTCGLEARGDIKTAWYMN